VTIRPQLMRPAEALTQGNGQKVLVYCAHIDNRQVWGRRWMKRKDVTMQNCEGPLGCPQT
jgi:hypothetical protein